MKYPIFFKKFLTKIYGFWEIITSFRYKNRFLSRKFRDGNSMTEFILYIKLITICRCLTGALILIRLYLTKQKYREGNKYVIPYFYQAGYSEELKTDISRALADLGDNTCIDFKVVNESSKGLSSFCHYYVNKKLCHHLSSKKSRFESNIFLTKVAIRTNKIPSTKPVRARFPYWMGTFSKICKILEILFSGISKLNLITTFIELAVIVIMIWFRYCDC